jgi:hypothetical protein
MIQEIIATDRDWSCAEAEMSLGKFALPKFALSFKKL